MRVAQREELLSLRSLARVVSAVVAAGCLTVGTSTAGAVTLSQSSSNTITSLNSAVCNSGAYTTENSWYRFFDLNGDHGITTSFTVSSVTFGIDTANDAGGLGQPLSVRLYALSGAPALANLTLIGSQSITVMDSESGSLRTVPVSGTLDPATADLGVEVFAPDGVASNNYFSIGSNASAETRPSYFRSPPCAQPEITTAAAAGVPNHRMVLSVDGDAAVAPGPANPTPVQPQPQPKKKCKKKGKRRPAAAAKKKCKRKKR